MMRYNRVEGFSVGASVEQQLGGGYSTIALARLGLADLEPNVEDTFKRTNVTNSIYLVGYNHLVSASDWGHPLSFGSSFSALMFGRDEGFYYKASGAELGGTREASFGGGTRVEWRAFVEQERTRGAEHDFAFDGANFRRISSRIEERMEALASTSRTITDSTPTASAFSPMHVSRPRRAIRRTDERRSISPRRTVLAGSPRR